MGILDKLNNTVTQGVGGAFGQGLLGNLSEQTPETLTKEFGMYLMEGESIHMGFKLIRDVVIFTDRRIIDIDKQGATGKKDPNRHHLSVFDH
ncbi:MAG: PH domain-containing protein [Clostridiaceae bacterium]